MGCSTAIASIFNPVDAHHVSPASVKALLDNLIFVSALLFAFCMPLLTTFGHDELAAADQRQFALAVTGRSWVAAEEHTSDRDSRVAHIAECAIDVKSTGCQSVWDYFIISTYFMRTAYFGAAFLWNALAGSLCLYGVLLGSFPMEIPADDVEGRVQFAKYWRRLFGPVICLGYVMALVGAICYFIACHIAVELVYPVYAMQGSDTLPGDDIATSGGVLGLSRMIETGAVVAPPGASPDQYRLVELTEASQLVNSTLNNSGFAFSRSSTYKDSFFYALGAEGFAGVLAYAAVVCFKHQAGKVQDASRKYSALAQHDDDDDDNDTSTDSDVLLTVHATAARPAAIMKWSAQLAAAQIDQTTVSSVPDDIRGDLLLDHYLAAAGVTPIGARAQLIKELRDNPVSTSPPLPQQQQQRQIYETGL